MQTPLMTQYGKIKAEHPDTVLLFRMGDFFETFEEDAKITAKVLGITLTKRSNGAAGEVPLAGFPHHALDTYLPKLVRAGYRVAVCEQIENPKFAKGIVKREVIEVVTPGVAFSDKLLDHKKNNYLMAVCLKDEIAGISFSDVSTGEFFAYEVSASLVQQQLEMISPSELLVQKRDKDQLTLLVNKINQTIRVTKVDDWIFNYEYAKELLVMQFKTVSLKGFGIDSFYAGIIASGAILSYLQETQKENLSHLSKVAVYNPSEYMALDFSTKRNLEITFSMQDGGREGSLISILDKTETAMGARLLKKWITAPLRKLDLILKRQDSVDELVKKKPLRKNLLIELKEIGDLERLISKVCTGRANPREIVAIKTSLQKIPQIKTYLNEAHVKTLFLISEGLMSLDRLVDKIQNSIMDSPPLNIADGGIIKKGFSLELDELRDISLNGKGWIANLQKSERKLLAILVDALPHLPGGPAIAAALDEAKRAQFLAALPGLKERAKTLIELVDGAAFLFVRRPLAIDEKAADILARGGRLHLAAMLPRLKAVEDWSAGASKRPCAPTPTRRAPNSERSPSRCARRRPAARPRPAFSMCWRCSAARRVWAASPTRRRSDAANGGRRSRRSGRLLFLVSARPIDPQGCEHRRRQGDEAEQRAGEQRIVFELQDEIEQPEQRRQHRGHRQPLDEASQHRADIDRQHAAGRGGRQTQGEIEADVLGEGEQKNIEEGERDAGEEILHRVNPPFQDELEAEHRHERDGDEHQRVFHRPIDEGVEVDRVDEAHAEDVGRETIEAGPLLQPPRIRARCAPDAGCPSGRGTLRCRSCGRSAGRRRRSSASPSSTAATCGSRWRPARRSAQPSR